MHIWSNVLEHRLRGFCHYGFLLLLIWPPFAFGAVHPWAFAALEIHIALLVVARMLRAVVSRQPLRTVACTGPDIALWCTWLSTLLLLVTLVLQLLPMSPKLLYHLSRPTYDIYHLFHPDWPHTRVTLSLHPYATTLGLMKALAYIGLFAFTVEHLRTQHHIRQAIWVITVTATIVAIIGICQHFAGLSAIYGWRDASYAHFFGPFLNRNHFAAYQVMAILIGLGFWAALSHRQRHPLTRIAPPLLFLLLFALAIMTGALVLTLSRGGILSLFVGLSLFVLLHRYSRKGRGLSLHLEWAFVGFALMSFWLGVGTAHRARLAELQWRGLTRLGRPQCSLRRHLGDGQRISALRHRPGRLPGDVSTLSARGRHTSLLTSSQRHLAMVGRNGHRGIDRLPRRRVRLYCRHGQCLASTSL